MLSNQVHSYAQDAYATDTQFRFLDFIITKNLTSLLINMYAVKHYICENENTCKSIIQDQYNNLRAKLNLRNKNYLFI
ncbi:hypothetical protein L2E82_01992 [Cichorium intybus]|uniref:Uncharacterized protein n=1 Tax=Cichorium intybus TaxID=13427 RepID=A0ACB9H0G7_CICIN|nr:hypothetical protein L2E82_01992 [Cichorium intybus]